MKNLLIIIILLRSFSAQAHISADSTYTFDFAKASAANFKLRPAYKADNLDPKYLDNFKIAVGGMAVGVVVATLGAIMLESDDFNTIRTGDAFWKSGLLIFGVSTASGGISIKNYLSGTQSGRIRKPAKSDGIYDN